MSKYEVNIKRFALLLLPTFWRKPLLATLAYAMVSPLGYLHTRFVLFRRDTVYRLTHNGQVCYLRAVLNDQFRPDRAAYHDHGGGSERGCFDASQARGGAAFLLPTRDTGRAFIINPPGLRRVNGFVFG